MTVADLLDRMSSAELSEWAALYRLENQEAKHRQDVASNRARMRRR